MSEIKFSSYKLYEDIKCQLKKIFPLHFLSKNQNIKDETLSIILGQGKNHINNKKYDKTQIALDLLKEYVLNLTARLSIWERDLYNTYNNKLFKKVKNEIMELCEKYRTANNLRRYARGISSVFDFHPDLKVDYFHRINTKTKAYWLGWLFAEAWITKYGKSPRTNRPYYRFGVGCSAKDQLLMKRFAYTIGFGINKIESRKYETKHGINRILIIRISNFDFSEFLRWHSFIIGKNKSKNIRIPRLKSRKYYLAFLLGYFDGDGKQGTTQISSGSRNFLLEIKQLFNIKNKIQFQKSEFYDLLKNRIVKGTTYKLSLGPDLFNEMLKNYKFSLARKRIQKEDISTRNKRLRLQQIKNRKFKCNKNHLKDLVWKLPICDIAELYNVHRNTIFFYIKKWRIGKPPTNYWKQKSNINKKMLNRSKFGLN